MQQPSTFGNKSQLVRKPMTHSLSLCFCVLSLSLLLSVSHYSNPNQKKHKQFEKLKLRILITTTTALFARKIAPILTTIAHNFLANLLVARDFARRESQRETHSLPPPPPPPPPPSDTQVPKSTSPNSHPHPRPTSRCRDFETNSGILAFGIYSMSQIEVFICGCASIHSHPKNGMSRQIRIWWCTTFLFHVPKLRFSFLTGVQIYSYSKNEGCLKFRVLCFGFGISCLKLRFPSAMSLSFKS